VSFGPIHLVDDDADVRMTLARLLRSGGHAVKEYGSGEDMLASAGSLDSGCVLLDISMPGQDGFAVRQALAQNSVALPIVMMTGSGDLTVLALKAGAADFMQKSFGRGDPLLVLERLLAEVCDG
jgi:two-component system response regulator FixJ